MANVIKVSDNLLNEDIPDLKVANSSPKEICDAKMINQSLIHKNKKTFKSRK